jgi:hypothetical protein
MAPGLHGQPIHVAAGDQGLDREAAGRGGLEHRHGAGADRAGAAEHRQPARGRCRPARVEAVA